MFKKTVLATSLSLATVSTFAVESTNKIDEIMIVTASRMEQPLTKVLAPVSVITATDIDRLQIQDMSGILSRLTSLESQTSGGPGSNSSLFVRGGNTAHTLVLVDGVRINSASLGTSGLQYIDVHSIERVELVRGPGSSLYGADAVSGILQIITKKKNDKKLSVSYDLGSHGYQRTGVQVGGNENATIWSLQLAHEELAGFDRATDDDFFNDDKDAYRNSHVNFNVKHEWTDAIASGVNYQKSDGETENDSRCLDGSFSRVDCKPFSNFEQELLSVDNTWKPVEQLEVKAQVSRSIDNTKNADDLALPSQVEGSDNYFKTTKDTYALQSTYALNDSVGVVVGTEYYNDKLKSSNDYLATSRDNMAWFSHLNFALGKNDFSLGLRNDDNEAYGSHTTESVAWGYNVTDAWRVIASWGTAFRAPTFNDLYWPADPYGIGNPDLDPEESENTELALKYADNIQRLSLSVFRNRIDGLIDWQPVDPNDTWGQWTPTNVDDARVEGFEIEYGVTLGAFSADANYSWIDPDDLSSDTRLQDRSRRLFNLDLDYSVGKFTYGTTLIARGDRYADAANTRQLPGYATVDLRTSFAATQDLNVYASLTNIFDKNYEARENFNEAGQGFKVGFNYSM